MISWDKALELASRVTNPITATVFALVIVAMTMTLITVRKRNPPSIVWLLGTIIFLLAMAPIASVTFLASRGVYRIRVVVLGTDGQPVHQADLSNSSGGELKQASGNWELDLPPQTKPSNGKITFYASIKDAYLQGESVLELKDDYFPTVTVRLAPSPAVTIRGTVVDESGRSVSGARVALTGYPEMATTDEMGNFSLPAHHADGQSISVRAEKGDLVAEKIMIAGSDGQLVLRKR